MKNGKIILIASQVLKLIEAVLIFIIGLTLIINGSIDDTIGDIVGVVLIFVCVATLITDVITTKSAFTSAASVNAGLLALGIVCIWVGIPLALFLALYLVVLGGYLVIEAILTFIFKRGVLRGVVYLVVAAILMTFGLLYIYNEGFREVLTIIIGVILLFVGVLLVVEAIIDLIHGLKLVNELENEADKEEVKEEQPEENHNDEVADAVMEK